MIKKEEIEKLAKLSRITVSPSEKVSFEKDIEAILSYVGEIHTAKGEETTLEPGVLHTVMREDGKPHEEGIYTEALLREMPETEKDYLKVKKILSQDE